MLVSRLTSVGLAQNKTTKVERRAQERGRRRNNERKGGKTTMISVTAGVVEIWRDTVAVASARGTAV